MTVESIDSTQNQSLPENPEFIIQPKRTLKIGYIIGWMTIGLFLITSGVFAMKNLPSERKDQVLEVDIATESKFADVIQDATLSAVQTEISTLPSSSPTPRVSPKPSPLPLNYDDLIVLEKNSIELESQFGERREASIRIVNNSDKKISWVTAKKTCNTNGTGCPINVKGSPQNIYSELEAHQSGSLVFEGWPFESIPRLEALFELEFYDMSTADNKLTTKTVRATLISPVHENIIINSDYDDKTSSNVDLTLNFKPRYLVPILMKNRHSYAVKGTCRLTDPSILQTINYSCNLPGESVQTDEGYYTKLQFLDDYSGPSSFDIEYVFTEVNGSRTDTKTLTVHVNK